LRRLSCNKCRFRNERSGADHFVEVLKAHRLGRTHDLSISRLPGADRSYAAGNGDVAGSGHLARLYRRFQMEVKVLSSIKEYQPGPPALDCIWSALGLPSRGTRLHDLIHQGLPFEHLDQIATLLNVQRGVISRAIGVSPATLMRRAKVGRFTTVESDRLVALVTLFHEALSLFENDKTAATEWMSSPVRGLGSKCPLYMLGTRVETKAVLDLIGRLERGILV
jgi:putative toxin-antitoxin system antitoxin component (TIGR02293 family)